MMLFRTLALFSLLALGATAAAAGEQPAAAAPAKPEHLTVLLDWFVNPDHVPLVVAKQRGLFAKAGLDVDLVAPADPSTPPRLVAAGDADLAVAYQPNLYEQVAEGLPVTRIATLIASPLNTLLALKGGPIHSIADLKGKTIGYSVGGFEDALLAAMLKQAGLSLKDVTLVNVNFALVPSLLSGRVDAVIGAFRNVETHEVEAAGKTPLAFYPEENGVPAYDELILIARTADIHRPALKRFVDALQQATIYTVNHPDEALALFFEAHPDLDNALNRAAFADTLRRFALRPAAVDRGRYERFGRFMKDAGLIKTVEPVDRYAVELH